MKNRIIKFLFSIFLIVFCSFFFYKNLVKNGFGFFNLQSSSSRLNLESRGADELMKGDIVTGNFLSKYKNLGIVAVRFTNRNRDSKDTVLFRLKEEDTNQWLYSAKYSTDQFQPEELFPFGFPLIENSSNKKYIFEIESLSGATGSGIFLGNTEPAFTTSSFFDKSDLFKNKVGLVKFFIQKVLNTIGNKHGAILALVYFSPFIFYSLLLRLRGSNSVLLLPVFSLGVLFDIFLIPKNENFYICSLVLLWVLTPLREKLDTRVVNFLSLSSLLISLVSTLIGENLFAEKSIVWFFILLVIGVIQQIVYPKTDIHLSADTFSTYNPLDKLPKEIRKHTTTLSRVAPFILAIYGAYQFIRSVQDIHKSYILFVEYYPEGIPYLILYKSLLKITLTVLAVFGITMTLKKRFRLNKYLVIFFILLSFSVITRDTISKNTTFKYVPKITSISPQETSEAWVDVTINGKSFQDKPFIGKVFIDGVEQGAHPDFWTNEKVMIRTNPSYTKSGQLCLRTADNKNSNCVPFKYNFNKNKLK